MALTIKDAVDWLSRLGEGMRSRYVRLLEEQIARERAEVERLRAENRALLNSLLSTAGAPPIEAPAAHPAQIAPVRRRSWTQIAMAREMEAARKANARERSEPQQRTG
jgi:hypothetical protein